MDRLAELWSTVWARATATQPVPDLSLVAATGVVALLLVWAPATWPRVRLGVTVVHEAGHAIVAVLVGRRLRSVHLHSDTSGLTVSSGKPRGPGMVAMLAAGYLAPAALGLLAALMLAAGHSMGLLWLLMALMAALIVWVRNGYGFLVLLLGAGAVVLLTTYADPQVQSVVAYLLTWVLLLAAPRPLLELLARGRSRGPRTDPGQLARLTPLPALAWTLLLLLANLAGLVVGAATLAPSLV
ncbi:M50 family metallopeptidase [Nocardioides flavescens]|uniref:M50 family peptidase n=1 Tax=Nocardioides flavescens TaxID=2691959 RepID=A0A6L7EY03_9ACTN|nr:M50 family metallopeptidase [Nocardioides flavescens]MXG90438.1 M50 family peptidase [Nocardioides flavescens]